MIDEITRKDDEKQRGGGGGRNSWGSGMIEKTGLEKPATNRSRATPLTPSLTWCSTAFGEALAHRRVRLQDTWYKTVIAEGGLQMCAGQESPRCVCADAWCARRLMFGDSAGCVDEEEIG